MKASEPNRGPLAKRIREVREKAGIRRKEVVGVSDSMMQKIENENRLPSIDKLLLIARGLQYAKEEQIGELRKLWAAQVQWLTNGKQPQKKEHQSTPEVSSFVKDVVLQHPPIPQHFIGREKDIEMVMHQADHGRFSVVIVGIGGIGKTALCSALAERLRTSFPDGVLYADLRGVLGDERGAASPGDILAEFIVAMRPGLRSEDLPETLAARQKLYLSTLRQPTADSRITKRVIFLDNALNSAQLQPLLPPGHCALIVTSRQYITLTGILTHELPALADNDAVILLKSLLPVSRHLNSTSEVISVLGGHPASIEMFAQHVSNERAWKPEQLVQKLKREAVKLSGIDAVLGLTWKALPPRLRSNFSRLGILADGFSLHLVCRIWNVPQEAGIESINALLGRCFLRQDDEDRYHLHDILREFANDHLRKNSKNLRAAETNYAAWVVEKMQLSYKLQEAGNESMIAAFDLVKTELVHIEAVFDRAALIAPTEKHAMETCVKIITLGNRCLFQIPPQKLLKWTSFALELAARVNEENWQHDVGNIKADVCVTLGRYALGRETLESLLKLDISEKPGIVRGNLLGHIGRIYRYEENWKLAEDYLRKAVDAARESGNRRWVGIWMGNLGSVHSGLGSYEMGISCRLYDLAVSQEVGDLWSQGHTLHGLGETYLECGKYCEARACLENRVQISKRFGDGFGEAAGNWLLGRLEEREKNIPEAIGYYDLAVTWDSTFGSARAEEHAQYLWTLKKKLATAVAKPLAVSEPAPFPSDRLRRID